jgi:glycosyltransferase involved in cell wall biosynthesis
MIASISGPGSLRTGAGLGNADARAKTRICMFASVPPPWHGSTYAVQLLLRSHFAEAFDVCHINTGYATSVRSIGRVELRKFWLLLRYLYRLVREDRRRHFDFIVITPAFSPIPFFRDAACILVATWFTGGRVVLWSHSNDALRLYERSSHVIRHFLAYVVRRACAVVTVGDRLRANFIPFLGPERVTAIPNGLPSRRVRSERDSTRFVRVLYVSNMLRAKGWMELLRAAEIVADSRPHMRVSFYGAATADSSRAEICRAFETSGYPERFRYEGAVSGEKKTTVFDEADVFCLPTYYPPEACPVAILEAMQAGLPVVSTEAGAIPELIVQGRGGFLVPERDVHGLAEAIAFLVDHPVERSQMGAFNRARFDEVHQMEKVADRWIAFIRDLERRYM